MGKYYSSNIERDENGKLVKVVEIRDSDAGLNQKPDIRVLPYDLDVTHIEEKSDGNFTSVKVKASRFEKNENTGLYEYKEYEY